MRSGFAACALISAVLGAQAGASLGIKKPSHFTPPQQNIETILAQIEDELYTSKTDATADVAEEDSQTIQWNLEEEQAEQEAEQEEEEEVAAEIEAEETVVLLDLGPTDADTTSETASAEAETEADSTVEGTDPEPTALEKTTFYEAPLESETLSSLASSTVTLLASLKLASSNAQHLVNKAHGDVLTQLDKPEFSPEVRIKHRQVDLGSRPDNIMSHVHRGVGRVRTDKFTLEKIQGLYESDHRFKYDYGEILSGMDEAMNASVYTKAMALKGAQASDRIVLSLSTPQLTSSSAVDNPWAMFLESTKGSLDTDRHASNLLDSFSDEVVNIAKERAISKQQLAQMDFLDRKMDELIVDQTDIKSEFVLYNTQSFLFNDYTASLEVITESVSLAESDIAARMTTALQESELHNVQRPTSHGLTGMRQLIQQANSANGASWKAMTDF